MPVRLKPASPRSRVKHTTNESLYSQNYMVIEVYVSTINSKTSIDQELKSEGQGHKDIFKNGEKQDVLANLDQYS